MTDIKIDFSKVTGKIKPMHAVNNGPAGSSVRKGNNTFDYFREAGIPYARNHDAAFYQGYGGEYTVDVHRIFTDFNADPYNPESYDFECTDKCVKDTFSVGTEVFYRLGSRIEHGKKKGTFPPPDFEKWAVICEHIIRHYNEGWANGFEYGIEYWEIWNEPDCKNADGSKPCWQGTEEQFIELFSVAAKHLKSCFPNLKIGGPAFSSLRGSLPFARKFFEGIRKNNVPLDFFSFHRYCKTPVEMRTPINTAYSLINEFGYPNAELILNEWNYIRGWLSEDWIYSLRSEKGLKGSSFVAGCMAVGQRSELDMLMYYDARPCGMNGMFDTDFLTALKGYYPFKMFNNLYKMGGEVLCEYNEAPVYCTAATDGENCGILVTNFEEDDSSPAVNVNFELCGADGKKATLYLLDDKNDMTAVATIDVKNGFSLEIPLFSTYYIDIK